MLEVTGRSVGGGMLLGVDLEISKAHTGLGSLSLCLQLAEALSSFSGTTPGCRHTPRYDGHAPTL